MRFITKPVPRILFTRSDTQPYWETRPRALRRAGLFDRIIPRPHGGQTCQTCCTNATSLRTSRHSWSCRVGSLCRHIPRIVWVSLLVEVVHPFAPTMKKRNWNERRAHTATSGPSVRYSYWNFVAPLKVYWPPSGRPKGITSRLCRNDCRESRYGQPHYSRNMKPTEPQKLIQAYQDLVGDKVFQAPTQVYQNVGTCTKHSTSSMLVLDRRNAFIVFNIHWASGLHR